MPTMKMSAKVSHSLYTKTHYWIALSQIFQRNISQRNKSKTIKKMLPIICYKID